MGRDWGWQRPREGHQVRHVTGGGGRKGRRQQKGRKECEDKMVKEPEQTETDRKGMVGIKCARTQVCKNTSVHVHKCASL